ncbi:MAG TPA: DUF4197 domain-containing protein [Bacteroidales bacterium]|nr:DUF4197 domain-containing protein [Bacteroidales bacterium]
MKNIYTLLIISLLLSFGANAQLVKDLKKAAGKIVNETSSTGLSEEEVGKALKEALTIGIEKGVAQLSKPDGYFKDPEIKIPMPDEAKSVEEKLRAIGQGKAVDDAIESMNRAAEDAANGAKDIFVTAIKQLTLKDVMNILNGSNDAATRFLEDHTRLQLVEKFKPVIKVSLDKVGATKYWNVVFTTYNKLPFVKKVDPDLVEYATNKAIDGLFVQIAKQELEIRKNPAARITDLLKKVFG